jgi:formylglycine-generating enzyme required for sulfatase activity
MSTADLGSVPQFDQQHGLRSEDILPPPFAWIEIPAGQVKLVPDDIDKKKGYLQENTIFDIPAFDISKYPITNAQFAKFIEAGGYREKKWWMAAGWDAREQGWVEVDDKRSGLPMWMPTGNPWTEPRYWQDAQLNGAEQPVVGCHGMNAWPSAVG